VRGSSDFRSIWNFSLWFFHRLAIVEGPVVASWDDGAPHRAQARKEVGRTVHRLLEGLRV
jgi:hypothetical protein